MRQRFASTEDLSVPLGWFSLGLGAAELFAPRGVSRLIGVKASVPTRTRGEVRFGALRPGGGAARR